MKKDSRIGVLYDQSALSICWQLIKFASSLLFVDRQRTCCVTPYIKTIVYNILKI